MLPNTLRMDAWWMSQDFQPAKTPSRIRSAKLLEAPKSFIQIVLVAVCLIAIADWLIFGRAVGLGLVIFSLLAAGAGLCLRLRQDANCDHTKMIVASSILILGLLPIIEYVQALSFLFFILGAIGFVTFLNRGTADLFDQFKITSTRWLFRFALDVPEIKHELLKSEIGNVDIKRLLSGLILPLSVGIVFVLLFVTANPVLEALSKRFDPLRVFADITLVRLVFWSLVLILVWPILRYANPIATKRRTAAFASTIQFAVNSIFTQISVRNTLILCNSLFLLQGLTDIGYLLAGAQLPDGMTYAEYAHRGAYPLLATALLAGGIAVAVSGFARNDTLIRFLTLIWMAQTAILLGSSVFRLSLYIDVYGLTLLRMWAGIWMGLVMAGIGLILIQILQSRPASWLVKWNLVLAIFTLYSCCFFNFTHFVGSYNFANLDAKNSTEYSCKLGGYAAVSYYEKFGLSQPNSCFPSLQYGTPIKDWREWSYRGARMDRRLSQLALELKQALPEMDNWRYGEIEEY